MCPATESVPEIHRVSAQLSVLSVTKPREIGDTSKCRQLAACPVFSSALEPEGHCSREVVLLLVGQRGFEGLPVLNPLSYRQGTPGCVPSPVTGPGT